MKEKNWNRRGFLLGEETLKIIIAVICIMFLVYLLFYIYYARINDKKKVEAGESLGRIAEIIGDTNAIEQNYEIPNPAGWYLFSFTQDIKPNSCANENCICICSKKIGIPLLNTEERQAGECSEKGACRIVKNIVGFEAIKIGSPDSLTNILIKKESGMVYIIK